MPRDIEPAELSAGRRAGRAAVGGKIATGNRLRDGIVVYLDAAGAWVTDVDHARVITTPEDEQVLKDALEAGVKGNVIIDAAVIDTTAADVKPARLREQIRAVGPTVRPDLARRKPW